MTDLKQKRQTFSKDFKIGLCRKVIDTDVQQRRLAADNNLHYATLSRWLKEYKLGGDKAFMRNKAGRPKKIVEPNKLKGASMEFLQSVVNGFGMGIGVSLAVAVLRAVFHFSFC